MDSLTKTLITKAAAYSAAFQELRDMDDSINNATYYEGNDFNGTWVRAYFDGLGYSSKYYYAA